MTERMSPQLKEAILLLVRRKHPTVNSWFKICGTDFKWEGFEIHCFFCNKIIDDKELIKPYELNEEYTSTHLIRHLKEKNLLVFV